MDYLTLEYKIRLCLSFQAKYLTIIFAAKGNKSEVKAKAFLFLLKISNWKWILPFLKRIYLETRRTIVVPNNELCCECNNLNSFDNKSCSRGTKLQKNPILHDFSLCQYLPNESNHHHLIRRNHQRSWLHETYRVTQMIFLNWTTDKILWVLNCPSELNWQLLSFWVSLYNV